VRNLIRSVKTAKDWLGGLGEPVFKLLYRGLLSHLSPANIIWVPNEVSALPLLVNNGCAFM
jgi:hypothetical protein